MTKERKKNVIIFEYSRSIQYKSILTINDETNSAWICFYGWENLIWKFHCFYFGIFLCDLLWKGIRYSFHRWINCLNTSQYNCVSYGDTEIYLFPYVFWNFTSQGALIFQIRAKYALLWSYGTGFHQNFLFILIWMSFQWRSFAAYLFWMQRCKDLFLGCSYFFSSCLYQKI